MRFLPVFLIGVSCLFGSERFTVLGKQYNTIEPKVAPIETMMQRTPPKTVCKSRGIVHALVLRVDFQRDDDPNTTGDGKFIMVPDTSEFTLGAGPHNRIYFQYLCESVRTFWESASMGQLQLDFSVYPTASDSAYTLPHEMSYYYPKNADSELTLARFIEYFQDVLHVADTDPSIVFSDYDEIMVIHAGADWQHDVFGDTPCDLPSFHITVEDQYAVAVDDGAKVISDFANVPEMITQDITTTEKNGITTYSGYGVPNAVMTHEFGHSLGLPDLYSSTNNRPAVGYWDIMDSGGSVSLSLGYDDNNDGYADHYYSVEGCFGSYPSAWSKEYLWGDQFRALGYLKDISDFDTTQPIELLAAGETVTPGPQQAYIIRVPLSDDEYLLLENRQTDHDKDNTTSLVSELDHRIVIYPSGYDNTSPDEYDFVLPGWIDTNGYAYGGGLVVWHIDDNVIFNEGTWKDGQWISNFEANTINTRHSRRGVSMIEADNMDDIGNPYSLLWTGTAYDPFFPYKPEVDDSGYFTGWSFIPFNDSLSATTEPAILMHTGDTAPYTIAHIRSDHYARPFEVPADKLSFRFGTHYFDGTATVADTQIDSLQWIGTPNQLGTGTEGVVTEIAATSPGGLTEIRHLWDGTSMDDWENPFGNIYPEAPATQQPTIVPWDNNDGQTVYPSGSKVYGLRGVQLSTPVDFGETITQPVFQFENFAFVSGTQHLFEYAEGIVQSWELPNARLACLDGILMAVSDQGITFLSPGESANPGYSNAGFFGDDSQAQPVAFYDRTDPTQSAYFLPTADGSIWRFDRHGTTRIFTVPADYAGQPTQLALGRLSDNGLTYIVFGVSGHIYAITPDGTLANGFPVQLYKTQIQPWSYPRILECDGQPIVLLENSRGGCTAVDGSGKQRPEYGLAFHGSGNDQLYYEQDTQRLTYVYPVTNSNGTQSIAVAYKAETSDPIIWNGFRNAVTGLYSGVNAATGTGSGNLHAYAFPSPSQTGQVRFRVFNAKNTIDIKVYDIAGSLVFQKKVIVQPGDFQDNIVWNTAKVASGMYFAIIKSDHQKATVRFAVEN